MTNGNDSDFDGLTDFEEWTGLDEGSSAFDGTTVPLSPNGYTSDRFKYDTDGDYVSDGYEAMAGTDPRSASDYLRVVALTNCSVGQVVKWASVTDKYYHVQSYSDGKTYSNCTANSIGAAGLQTEWTNKTAHEHPFFSISVDIYH